MGIQAFRTLAKQRSRVTGELRRLQQKIDKAEQDIAAHRARMTELNTKLSAFDAVLAAQETDIDPDVQAPPRTPHARKRYYRHGELTILFLEALRVFKRPLSTAELMTYVEEKKSIIWREMKDREGVRHVMKNQLRAYAAKGLVVKLGDAGPSGKEDVFWALPEYATVPMLKRA